jgi:hypothetical protein
MNAAHFKKIFEDEKSSVLRLWVVSALAIDNTISEKIPEKEHDKKVIELVENLIFDPDEIILFLENHYGFVCAPKNTEKLKALTEIFKSWVESEVNGHNELLIRFPDPLAFEHIFRILIGGEDDAATLDPLEVEELAAGMAYLYLLLRLFHPAWGKSPPVIEIPDSTAIYLGEIFKEAGYVFVPEPFSVLEEHPSLRYFKEQQSKLTQSEREEAKKKSAEFNLLANEVAKTWKEEISRDLPLLEPADELQKEKNENEE